MMPDTDAAALQAEAETALETSAYDFEGNKGLAWIDGYLTAARVRQAESARPANVAETRAMFLSMYGLGDDTGEPKHDYAAHTFVHDLDVLLDEVKAAESARIEALEAAVNKIAEHDNEGHQRALQVQATVICPKCKTEVETLVRKFVGVQCGLELAHVARAALATQPPAVATNAHESSEPASNETAGRCNQPEGDDDA